VIDKHRWIDYHFNYLTEYEEIETKIPYYYTTFNIIKEDFTAGIYCRLHQGSEYQRWANSYNIQPRFCCISKSLTFCQSFGKVIPILQDNLIMKDSIGKPKQEVYDEPTQ
jgi:hypothetical protein